MRRSTVALALSALLAGACGGGGHDDHEAEAADDTSETAAPAATPERDGPRAQTYGHEALPTQATRTIEVKLTDALRFEPASISVKKGEIITFKVTNVGAMPHEVTIGGEISQKLHEAEMLAGGEMEGMTAEEQEEMEHQHGEGEEHAEGAAAKVPTEAEIAELDKQSPAFKSLHVMPGETQELTWAFTGEQPLIGCHLPGHWDGGMKGEVVFS
jgi:uncharacterized cupredoxin-like copper-binding protein